ncbi:AAA family ATPase [Gynuella sunshinyii]|uniref:Putative ATPase/kinase involved in NAD metabolism n=1 Tax=Gynuella sunshinyii YC6258 TaxID=1445510 RepID=A0A0C5VPP7_9GAMM|nr:AAA family ATPase [Gynuella sunshinyii]AJQ95383.1 putative ATPase/kinase involved in NAD metabolism [Gynuella sunshinyii YC6258]
MKKIGLTLGKFAPLHKGHQLLIETALAEMDRLKLIIYDSPEVTKIPLAVRSGWIKSLYPQVEVIEAWNGPSQVGYSYDLMRQHERYVIEELGVAGITHFYSSEPYGEHMSQALGAIDRRVDVDRTQVPISATAIRRDSYGHKDYMASSVYRDLITNVAILGAPSTGKTTLSRALADRFNTQWMPEYGREYWEKYQMDRKLQPGELIHIAEQHLNMETTRLNGANQYLFTDTTALTTATFCRYYHGYVPERLQLLAGMSASRYDLTFLCDIDIPYEDTWDRSGEGQRDVFQRQIIQMLGYYKIPYVLLSGTLEQRMASVSSVLNRYQKYMNILEVLNCSPL